MSEAERKAPAQKKRGTPPVLKGVRRSLAILGKTMATVFLIMVITGSIMASILTVYIVGFLDDESEFDLTNLELRYTTILYATDPETGEDYELQRLHGAENRIWCDIDDMPQSLLDATVCGEDKRFYEHQGVDWRRTVFAFVNMLRGGDVQGGSTLTQQLIKNISGDKDVLVERKIKEIFRALSLEKKYSKEEILEAYLNSIHLGNNTDGVQAAANLYFGKDVSELSIAESAALVAVTQNPSKRELFNHMEGNTERREWILGQMYEQEKITEQEYNAALKEELNIVSRTAQKEKTYSLNYFEDYVLDEVVEDLVNEKGYTETKAEEELLTGGFRVYTTMDANIQNYLDEKFADLDPESTIFPSVRGYDLKNGVYVESQPDCAMVVMKPDGTIVGLAGGRGEKQGDRVLNLATDGVRQPGSAIKPVASYGPAMDFDMIYWSKIFQDGPVSQEKNEQGVLKDWPINHYRTYLGPITVDEALRRSTNTVAVRVVELLSPQTCFNFLRDKFHFTTLVEDGSHNDIGRAQMALGAMTNGVTVLELTAAYQIYANGGLYYEPHSYTKVLDSEGNIILDKSSPVPERVVSEDTAEVMNKLLQRVTGAQYGTGTAARFGSMPVAGKTGTSSNDIDQWFVGMTPYYVGGVWFGYADNSNIQVQYTNYAPPIIWRNVMSAIHEGMDVTTFPESGKVVAMEYCTVSGEIATASCPATAQGWYKESNIPGTCTEHLGSFESEEIDDWWGDDDEDEDDE